MVSYNDGLAFGCRNGDSFYGKHKTIQCSSYYHIPNSRNSCHFMETLLKVSK